MRIINDVKLDYSDVLIRPKRSTLRSRKEVVLERTYKFLHSKRKWTGIPMFTANMYSSGTFEMAKTLSKHKIITSLHKYYSIEELEEFFKEFNEPDYVAYTTGIRKEDIEKLNKMLAKGLGDKFNFLILDVPNAYLERVIETLKYYRSICPNHTIVAGNVVTNEMTEQLILNGADIVKVGIGPGSACITRRKTGVGYPQLSATIECADAAHGISNETGHGLIISDGGLVHNSCVAKAFCGGADFIMSGSLFSGFDQSGGDLIEKNGNKYKEYIGSSSNTAMKKFYGKVDPWRTSEGRTLHIPYKGDINNFLQDLFGSLRSTATYIGAKRLKEFSKRATFLKVNKQLNESFANFDTHKD